VLLKNRTEKECTKVLLEIKADYQVKARQFKKVVFDCEPEIVLVENNLTANGVRLLLKVA
jgi:hypothetical protein